MTDREFEYYVGRYRQSVFAAAMCVLKNPSDADDVTQDVFLRLYTHGGSFESDEHVKAWLLRCTVNRSRDMLRTHWYRFSRPLSEAENIGCHDRTDDMLALVMKLNVKCRAVMYLHYYEGYTVKETAKLLRLSEPAVKSRLMRGREQLKKLLGGERIDDNDL